MRPWEQRAAALSRRAPRWAKVAEIGFGVGKMAHTLANTRPDLRLTMVDSFLPGDEQPERYRATGDNFATASRDSAEGRYGQALDLAARMQWTVILADSVEAAAQFADGHFDLVFIDGDHSYEGVRRDLAAWSPKVARGGYLGGHDYRNPDPRFDFSGVERAVDEAFPAVETDENLTWWVRL